MKILTTFTSIIIFILLFPFTSYAVSPAPVFEDRIEGKIVKITDEKILTDNDVRRKYQKIELDIYSGKLKDKKLTVENGKLPIVSTVEYKVGENVSISVTRDPKGRDVYFITDHVRKNSLYLLFGIFILITLLIGGKKGAASILGMGISFTVIFIFVLPQILSGRDPVNIAILSALFIIPINFFLSHGFNKKTGVAVLGTIIALGITGSLANYFVNSANLTGFSSDESTFLQSIKQGVIEFKGLLLAGIIIGALGILDDITVSQTSIVFQLRSVSPNMKFGELFQKGMEVGRDHIASMVNTLVLVYTGAAFPLLLLFVNNPRSFTEIINYEPIAEEIVRTLVVSSGLILSVPIVTILAVIASHPEFKRAFREIIHSLK